MVGDLTSLSRLISLILRHKPDTVGLSLDEHGYVGVDALIEAINSRSNFFVDESMLDFIVRTDNKKRYSYSSDGTMIRANQGHSVNVDLGLKECTPPRVLYHGTGKKYLESILREGLKSKSRNHVHLSKDIATAVEVGKRHGKPVVLQVETGLMHFRGYKFYLSENGVWLCDSVPVKYISVVERKE